MDSCIRKARRYSRKWAYNIFGGWQSSRRHNFTIYDCRDLSLVMHARDWFLLCGMVTRGYNFFYLSAFVMGSLFKIDPKDLRKAIGFKGFCVPVIIWLTSKTHAESLLRRKVHSCRNNTTRKLNHTTTWTFMLIIFTQKQITEQSFSLV